MRLPVDFWELDPMPVAPDVPLDSMAWHRWVSRVTLQARQEAAERGY
jgi:hypothetical protein